MFSQNQMVKARKAIESLYKGTCSITEYQEYTKTNKSVGHQEVVVLEDEPCRLSFSSSPNTTETETAAHMVQTIKLFLAPDVVVKAGSKVTVTQNDVTTEYKSSGVPALYETHQEIVLELFKGWA